jgi:hypothetical protein
MKYRSCGPNTSGSKQKREGQVSLPHLGLNGDKFSIFYKFITALENILSINHPIQKVDLIISQIKVIIFLSAVITKNYFLAALGLDGRLSVVAAVVAGEDFSVVVSRFHIIFLSFFIVSLLYHILLDLSIPYAKIFAKVEEITATAVAPIVSHICNGLAHC